MCACRDAVAENENVEEVTTQAAADSEENNNAHPHPPVNNNDEENNNNLNEIQDLVPVNDDNEAAAGGENQNVDEIELQEIEMLEFDFDIQYIFEFYPTQLGGNRIAIDDTSFDISDLDMNRNFLIDPGEGAANSSNGSFMSLVGVDSGTGSSVENDPEPENPPSPFSVQVPDGDLVVINSNIGIEEETLYQDEAFMEQDSMDQEE